DISQNGLALLEEIMQIYKNYEFKTQVIAASIRSPTHVLAAAKIGVHIATVPPEIFEKLFYHPLTEKGISIFLEDYKKALENSSSNK
ncbi:MAG: fructose-6-phosphate aldolase, partial [Candidatus Micrarchaeota archaeon]|nr:fructose-6-phosphate aldolase [Candidatus Micrarchaeota archaeon]